MELNPDGLWRCSWIPMPWHDSADSQVYGRIQPIPHGLRGWSYKPMLWQDSADYWSSRKMELNPDAMTGFSWLLMVVAFIVTECCQSGNLLDIFLFWCSNVPSVIAWNRSPSHVIRFMFFFQWYWPNTNLGISVQHLSGAVIAITSTV